MWSGSVGEVGPHVEAEAPEVHRPGDVGEVGGHERVATSVPFGVLTTVVCSQSGAPFGTRFWKNDVPARRRRGSAA